VDDVSEPLSRGRLRADRREALLAAARETFARKGLAGTTVRDIAKAASIDHAIIYRHFDSKQAIFDAALIQPLSAALRGWVEFSQSSSAYITRDAPERTQGALALEQVMRATAEAAPFLGVVLFSEHGPDFYRQHLKPALDEFVRGIEGAKNLWDHREFDAHLPAMVVLGTSLLAGLCNSFEDGEVSDLASFANHLQGLILDGLRIRSEEQ
jgi:AcrR family transcriptional regulator